MGIATKVILMMVCLKVRSGTNFGVHSVIFGGTGKRDDVELPENYYFHDDPNEAPLVTWRAHANLFYSNWINYYVYQETPYNIEDIQ